MAFIPSPDSYAQKIGKGKRGSQAIINGRRVSLDHDLHRDDLQNMVGGPGRRPVKIGSHGVQFLESKPFYNINDFRDSQGNLCKISSIPDRTKGGDVGGERVLIFLDLANIESGGKPFGLLHYGDLLNYLGEGRFLVDAYAYVPIDPHRPEARRPLIQHLQRHGWLVNQKMGKIVGMGYKSNVDIEICMDMMDAAHQIHPDIIVLCSGDGDFLPLVRRLRRMGIRTEVAAFENSVDAELPYEASGFISLDVWQKDLLDDSRPMMPAEGLDENECDQDERMNVGENDFDGVEGYGESNSKLEGNENLEMILNVWQKDDVDDSTPMMSTEYLDENECDQDENEGNKILADDDSDNKSKDNYVSSNIKYDINVARV